MSKKLRRLQIMTVEGAPGDSGAGGSSGSGGSAGEAGAAGGASAADQFEPITSQEEFDRRIQARIKREKDRQKELRDENASLKAQVKDHETAEDRISELENELRTAQADRDRFKGESETKDRELLRVQVATAKGVPAHRIGGDTQEDLEADAERYLEELQGRGKGLKGSFKSPGSESGTGGEKPRAGTLQSGRERAMARLGKAEAN